MKRAIKRNIKEIVPVATSHRVGEKRVFATQAELGKPVTQIAQTELKTQEHVEKHVHPTMDEHFFFLEGRCQVMVNDDCHICKGGDYLYVPATCSHEITVEEETTMITFGIEI